MEGPHNVQGWDSIGPIPEKQQPASLVWHEPWQARLTGIYALLFTVVAGNGIKGSNDGFFNLDAARWGREKLAPRDFANSDYYGLWLNAIEIFLAKFGHHFKVSRQDLYRRRITTPQRLSRALAIGQRASTQLVPGCEGAPVRGLHVSQRYDPTKVGSISAIGDRALFSAGDRVRIKKLTGTWHTRCYPYIQGAIGTVMQYYGLSEENPARLDGRYHGPYPEVTCQGKQKFYAPVYSVRFRAEECFGSINIDKRVSINIDVWEPMMEKVS